MTENDKLVLTIAAASGVLIGIAHGIRIHRRRKVDAEIDARTLRYSQAYHAAAERVKEAIQSGEFKPNSLVEIETAFDFETIVELSK